VESCGEDSTNIQINNLGEEAKMTEESKGPDKPDLIARPLNRTAPIKSNIVSRGISYDETKRRVLDGGRIFSKWDRH
jgi:hypothetical protein